MVGAPEDPSRADPNAFRELVDSAGRAIMALTNVNTQRDECSDLRRSVADGPPVGGSLDELRQTVTAFVARPAARPPRATIWIARGKPSPVRLPTQGGPSRP